LERKGRGPREGKVASQKDLVVQGFGKEKKDAGNEKKEKAHLTT